MNIQTHSREQVKTVRNYFEYSYINGGMWRDGGSDKGEINPDFYETLIGELRKYIHFEQIKDKKFFVDVVRNIKSCDALSDCSLVFYLTMIRTLKGLDGLPFGEVLDSTRIIVSVEYVLRLALVKVRIFYMMTPQNEHVLIKKYHQNFSRYSITHIIDTYFEPKIHGYVIGVKGIIEQRGKNRSEEVLASGILAIQKKIVLVPYHSPYGEKFFKRLS